MVLMEPNIRISTGLYLNAQNNYLPMNKLKTACYGYNCSAAEKCDRYCENIKYIFQEYFPVTPGKDETCKSFTAI